MSILGLVLLIIIALALLPAWGYHSYGYRPVGIVGIILIIVVVLLLTGRL